MMKLVSRFLIGAVVLLGAGAAQAQAGLPLAAGAVTVQANVQSSCRWSSGSAPAADTVDFGNWDPVAGTGPTTASVGRNYVIQCTKGTSLGILVSGGSFWDATNSTRRMENTSAAITDYIPYSVAYGATTNITNAKVAAGAGTYLSAPAATAPGKNKDWTHALTFNIDTSVDPEAGGYQDQITVTFDVP